MAARKLWFVRGGVSIDSARQEIEPGIASCFGPFHDAATAERAWRAEMRRRVDTAQHRLSVLEVPRRCGESAG